MAAAPARERRSVRRRWRALPTARMVGEEWHRRPFRATLKGFDEMFDVVQLTPVSGSLRVSWSPPTPAE